MSDSLTARNPDTKTEVNIQSLHNSLNRELDDPRDGFEPIPVWMTIIYGVLLFWGGMYMSTNSGAYRADVFDRTNPVYSGGPPRVAEKLPKTVAEYEELGKKVFSNCVGCHGAEGKGNPSGGIPPLALSEWVSGTEASPARLSRILLYGLQGKVTVSGQEYNGVMPAWGQVLKPHQIAGVLTYVRSSWKNKEALTDMKQDVMITTEMIEAAKKAEGARGAMSQEALKAIPVSKSDLEAGAAGTPTPKEPAKDAPKEPAKDAPKDAPMKK